MNRLNQQRNRILEDIGRFKSIMNYITEQQQGEVNYTIQQLQQLLNSKGYNVGQADGILGTNTLNGILKALGNTSALNAQPATNTTSSQMTRDYQQPSAGEGAGAPAPPVENAPVTPVTPVTPPVDTDTNTDTIESGDKPKGRDWSVG